MSHGFNEVLLHVYWTTNAGGHNHLELQNKVSADLGLDAAPSPPFTREEMEVIMFSAKMAAIKCLRKRKSRPSLPTPGVEEIQSEQKKGSREKLTKAQLDELRRLYKEPQNTYGSARARVQNNLVLAGLAQFSLDGVVYAPRTACSMFGHKVIADQCVITAAGRSLVESGLGPEEGSAK